MSNTSLVQVESGAFMPVLTAQLVAQRRQQVYEFVKSVMVEGLDYGTFEGVERPSLYQPGADKLQNLFGLSPEMILEEAVKDWTGADHGGEPFFSFQYRCRASSHGGVIVAEYVGICHSFEKKYRYRWVAREAVPRALNPDLLEVRQDSERLFHWQYQRRETVGKYGHPEAWWASWDEAIRKGQVQDIMADTKKGPQKCYVRSAELFRIPNPEVADSLHTISSMAQKRARVGAIRIGTGATEFFTQDIEDNPEQYGASPALPKAELVLTDEQRLNLTNEMDDIVGQLGPKGQEEARKSIQALNSDQGLVDLVAKLREGLEMLKAKRAKKAEAAAAEAAGD